jgi:hypothetical protein
MILGPSPIPRNPMRLPAGNHRAVTWACLRSFIILHPALHSHLCIAHSPLGTSSILDAGLFRRAS